MPENKLKCKIKANISVLFHLSHFFSFFNQAQAMPARVGSPLLGSDKWSTLKGRLPGVPHADTLVAILYVRFRLF